MPGLQPPLRHRLGRRRVPDRRLNAGARAAARRDDPFRRRGPPRRPQRLLFDGYAAKSLGCASFSRDRPPRVPTPTLPDSPHSPQRAGKGPPHLLRVPPRPARDRSPPLAALFVSSSVSCGSQSRVARALAGPCAAKACKTRQGERPPRRGSRGRAPTKPHPPPPKRVSRERAARADAKRWLAERRFAAASARLAPPLAPSLARRAFGEASGRLRARARAPPRPPPLPPPRRAGEAPRTGARGELRRSGGLPRRAGSFAVLLRVARSQPEPPVAMADVVWKGARGAERAAAGRPAGARAGGGGSAPRARRRLAFPHATRDRLSFPQACWSGASSTTMVPLRPSP